MSERIVPDIKGNFLIIGLTGPLRSGCTTAADLFAKEFRKQIKLCISSQESNQKKIEEQYYCIAKLLMKSPSYQDDNIKLQKRSLDALLKEREVLKVLTSEFDEGMTPIFYYISMSEMLLKYAVEYFLNNKGLLVDTKYEEIVKAIRRERFNVRKINSIKKIIIGKRYKRLKVAECRFYDEYLRKIKKLMTKLKKNIEQEMLGSILQDLGDNIRKHGNPFRADGDPLKGKVVLLANQANQVVKYMRNRQDADSKRRHHFVIECFRNPFEVEYLRYRYSEFYLLSIFADEKERQKKGSFSKGRDKRDAGSGKLEEIHKQNVSRCVYFSDIAINNDSGIEGFYKKLLYYYALIRQPGCVTPTNYEIFMNLAYSLSLMSGCISRQVGAVIIGKNGYVVGAGWNDVGEGQVGCGYRQVIDTKNISENVLVTNPESEKSFRTFLQKNRDHDSFCYKDEYSTYVLKEKYNKFLKDRAEDIDSLGAKRGLLLELAESLVLKYIKTKRLEYCRALHAEENALLQTTKIGGMGVMGGAIYTTTFPCELCAKKIYQSGIEEVVYTEPYPESISQEVFLRDGIKKIKLTQFEGVKSSSYFWLYKGTMDKKELQTLQGLKLM